MSIAAIKFDQRCWLKNDENLSLSSSWSSNGSDEWCLLLCWSLKSLFCFWPAFLTRLESESLQPRRSSFFLFFFLLLISSWLWLLLLLLKKFLWQRSHVQIAFKFNAMTLYGQKTQIFHLSSYAKTFKHLKDFIKWSGVRRRTSCPKFKHKD